MTAAYYFFFFNDTATTEIYTLSLHDALPIYSAVAHYDLGVALKQKDDLDGARVELRSEEHTSELQSQSNLVCRLLLEKKNLSTNDSDGRCRGLCEDCAVLSAPEALHRLWRGG